MEAIERTALEYMEDAELGVTGLATLEYTNKQGLETSAVILRRRLFRPRSDLCPSGVDSTLEYIGEGGVGGDSKPHNWR